VFIKAGPFAEEKGMWFGKWVHTIYQSLQMFLHALPMCLHALPMRLHALPIFLHSWIIVRTDLELNLNFGSRDPRGDE
jgi:hypothetical protein